MKALILAAGLGKRLGLQDLLKPMYKIEDKPVLEHNILLCKKHNIKDIFINLHHKADLIKNYFGDGSNFGVNIQYSFEKELLGTSGAVKNIESFWDKSPFFVLYGDNYTDIDFTEMMTFHKSAKPLATIAVFDPKKVLNSGIAGGYVKMDENNTILSFIEGKRSESGGYVNAGVYILESAVLAMIPKDIFSDFGKDIFPKMLKQGSSLKGYETKSFVIAIDTNEALEYAKKISNRRK